MLKLVANNSPLSQPGFPCNQESGHTVVCWQIGSCYEDNEGIKLLCTPSPWKQRGSCRQQLPGFYLCLHVCVICEQTSPRGLSAKAGWLQPCSLANSWCCTDLLAVHLSGCQGGDRGKEPQPLKGAFFLQHPQGCSRLFYESLRGYQDHLGMLGQRFSSSGTLSFPGTKPKATDPAKHLTKDSSKVMSRRNKILWLDHNPFGHWLWNFFCLSFPFYLLKGGLTPSLERFLELRWRRIAERKIFPSWDVTNKYINRFWTGKFSLNWIQTAF